MMKKNIVIDYSKYSGSTDKENICNVGIKLLNTIFGNNNETNKPEEHIVDRNTRILVKKNEYYHDGNIKSSEYHVYHTYIEALCMINKYSDIDTNNTYIAIYEFNRYEYAYIMGTMIKELYKKDIDSSRTPYVHDIYRTKSEKFSASDMYSIIRSGAKVIIYK
jgi:hypothetical protein